MAMEIKSVHTKSVQIPLPLAGLGQHLKTKTT